MAEYREVKKWAGRYELYRGEEYIGEVYRMPYANMSKSWRVLFHPDRGIYDRPICNSKREAIETLKKVSERGSL